MKQDITTNKQQVFDNLAKRNIFSTVETTCETVALNYSTNPEGFKLFYEASQYLPLYGFYWYQDLANGWYKEVTLTPEEFKQVLEWRKSQ